MEKMLKIKFNRNLKFFLIMGLLLTSCQLRTSKTTVVQTTSNQSEKFKKDNNISESVKSETILVPNQSPGSEAKTEAKIETKSDTKPEQFGIIFSGGGVRTWSYISLLKEMQKYKMPIVAVAGIEWGSVIAGIYSENISPNEVEWELSKFKSLDDWAVFVKKVFKKKATSGLKIPFGCSSLNLKNQTSYILNKGQLDALIPFCVPAPGVVKPYTDSVASMSDVSGLVQFLKSNGATKIILLNVLSSKLGKPLNSGAESPENIFWIQSSSLLTKKNNGIDDMIDIDLTNISVEKFDLRKDVLNAAIPSAKDQLKKIANKYGF